MIIKKIQLKNITTHKNNIIEFEEGINVLMGPNGTGKTTVLTMIGYALFDYIPGKNQKSYVRNASPEDNKYGIIKIWIIGKDKQTYYIKRTIGKPNNEITVICLDTKKELKKIDNRTNLRIWIQDQMGLSKNFSLSSIFEHAIGVNQGTFTAPFLMRPRERRKIFSPLLNVHIYIKIVEEYLKINKSFENEIHNLDKEISRLEGELEGKDQYIEERKDLTEKLGEIKKTYITTTKKYKDSKKKYDDLFLIAEKLEQNIKDYDYLDVNEKNFSRNIKFVKGEIAEAVIAKKICNETKGDFSNYKVYSEKEKILQEENKKLQKNIEEKYELNQNLGELETSLRFISEQIEDINKKSGNLPKLEEKFLNYKSNEQEIQDLANQLGSITVMQENLKKLTQTNIILEEKIKIHQKSLKILPDLEKNYVLIEPLNQKIINLNQKIAIAKKEIARLEQNKKDSADGNCPLLHERCKNIEGDSLEDHFQEEIKKEIKKLVESDKNLEILLDQMENLRKDEVELNKLKTSKIELKELQKQFNQNYKDIKKLKEKTIEKKKLENSKEELRNEQKLLENDVKQFNIIKEKIKKELPKFNQDKGNFDKEIQQLKRKIEPYNKIIKNLERIPDDLDHIQQKMATTENNYNLYLKNVKSMEKLSKYNQDLNELNKKLQNLKNEMKNIKQEKRNLEKQFDEEQFLNLTKEKDVLNEKSIELRGEIKNKKENLVKILKILENLVKKEKTLNQKNQILGELKKINDFSEKIRFWFKDAQPKITEALMARINDTASILFRKITDEEAVQLKWQKDYDIHVITAQNPLRIFSQLSGGEQMSAALAIRLAVLKVLTKIDFAFFDEPTTNLDAEKRKNLASCIQNIPGFKQLFVISHDETFGENADYLIRFSKNSYEETDVNFLNKGK